MFVSKYNEEDKERWLEEFKRNGKSASEYSKEIGVPPTTLRYWIKNEMNKCYNNSFGEIKVVDNTELSDVRNNETQIRYCGRKIRPFAAHRKNWLFADTVEGAKANAVYYSLIESAKANHLNIYKYIKYLLDELSQLEGEQQEEEVEKYLPWSKELPEEIMKENIKNWKWNKENLMFNLL